MTTSSQLDGSETWLRPQENYAILNKKEKRVAGPVTFNTLTEEQLIAANEILEYIEDKESPLFYYLLTGYAGTGKTYLISKLQEYLIYHHKKKLVVTAPTNKAVKVLKEMADIGDTNLAFMTIHKLLGLKPKINRSGQLTFISDYSPEEIPKLAHYDVLFIDEVSMLSNELFTIINNIVVDQKGKIKVVFIGDPAQIPPVSFDNSIPLVVAYHEKYKIKEVGLKTIQRTALDNPLLVYASFIRANLQNGIDNYQYVTQVRDKGAGIICIPKSEKDMIYDITHSYFTNDIFKIYPDFMKIIAWRNVTVDAINDKIRRLIYENIITDPNAKLPRIMLGEKLIVDEPVILQARKVSYIIYNVNDEIEVLSMNIGETNPTIRLDDGLITNNPIKFYDCVVTSKEDNHKHTIRIIHEDSLDFYKNVLQDCTMRIALMNQDVRSSNWARFYQFKNLFAAVKYNYAITAHKCQGSTYENCMILNWDMMINPNISERNRIRYVAVTRPRSRLFIIN